MVLSEALLGFSVPDNQPSMTAHYKVRRIEVHDDNQASCAKGNTHCDRCFAEKPLHEYGAGVCNTEVFSCKTCSEKDRNNQIQTSQGTSLEPAERSVQCSRMRMVTTAARPAHEERKSEAQHKVGSSIVDLRHCICSELHGEE